MYAVADLPASLTYRSALLPVDLHHRASSAAAQQVNILIIDKGKMKLKDAGFPSAVLENTPKYLRRSKVPVVKAKVGPKIMTLMCDASIYDLIPVKKEVKATVSGIYITAVKGVRGSLEAPPKKKGFWARLRNK